MEAHSIYNIIIYIKSYRPIIAKYEEEADFNNTNSFKIETMQIK